MGHFSNMLHALHSDELRQVISALYFDCACAK